MVPVIINLGNKNILVIPVTFFSFTVCISKTELDTHICVVVCAAKEHKRSPKVDKSGVFIFNSNINSVSCH